MKALTEGFVSGAFNSKIAHDLRAQALTQDMLQAFYRREHATITHLAEQGAFFTAEMLQVAVGFRDQHLARACLDGGVMPNDAMVKFAIDSRAAPLAHLLMGNLPPEKAEVMKAYAARRDAQVSTQDYEHVI